MDTSTERRCEICNKPLNRHQERFCSRECHGKHKTRKGTEVISCTYCGKEFTAPKCKERRFCSRQCFGKYRHDQAFEKVTCGHCGKEFKALKSLNREFCSASCYNEWVAEDPIRHPCWKGGPELVSCSLCDKEFELPHGYYHHQKDRGQKHFFCSRKCLRKWQSISRSGKNHYNWQGGDVEVTCAQCNKVFGVSRGRVSFWSDKETKKWFCCSECLSAYQAEHLVGKGNPNWRGGVSIEPYTKDFTQQLRDSIRARDNYTCQLCGMSQEQHIQETGSKLNCHHIDYRKDNSIPENLITLCNACHGETNHNRDHYESLFREMLDADPRIG